MDVARTLFDLTYGLIKPFVFQLTSGDPRKAHELFVLFCRFLNDYGLEKLVLDNRRNYLDPGFELSNAAGFNKDGRISPTVLKFLGFDRAVVGTVTGEEWKGNSGQVIWRYPKTSSMVNWMGLPGEGARSVAEKLRDYGDHGVPLTANFMSTPGKQGGDLLNDLERTILAIRDVPYVDRWELNISCPNTNGSDREENLRTLGSMLGLVEKIVYEDQEIYLKVSPDSTKKDVDDTLDVIRNHRVNGFVIANTTTKHDRRYIPISPTVNGNQVGGASGDAVYRDSLRVQRLFDERRESDEYWKIIACGGINSVKRVAERLECGAEGVQIYTPFVFLGPKLLERFREYRN